MSDLPEKVGPVPLDKPWHQLRAFATKKLGPLPVWIWAAAGTGILVGAFLLKGKLPGLGNLTPAATTGPTDTTGGGGSGSGGDTGNAPADTGGGGAGGSTPPPVLIQGGGQQSDTAGSLISAGGGGVISDGGGLFGPAGGYFDVTQRAGERSTEGAGVPYVAPGAPPIDVTQRAGERSTEGAGAPYVAPASPTLTGHPGKQADDVIASGYASGGLGGNTQQLNSTSGQAKPHPGGHGTQF